MPTKIEMDLPDRMWKSRAETAETEAERLNADLRRLHIWAGIAATYVERYTKLRPDDRNARSDLEHLLRLLSDTKKPEPSIPAGPQPGG